MKLKIQQKEVKKEFIQQTAKKDDLLSGLLRLLNIIF